MNVMGWSNAAMVKRYAHVTARLRRDIADRLNTYFWSANETESVSGRPDSGGTRALCLLRKTGGQGQGRTADLPFFGCSGCPAQVTLCESNWLLMAASGRWRLPMLPSRLPSQATR